MTGAFYRAPEGPLGRNTAHWAYDLRMGGPRTRPQGHHVPVSMISDADKMKDDLVRNSVRGKFHRSSITQIAQGWSDSQVLGFISERYDAIQPLLAA